MTGIDVPDARCSWQPMFAEAITAGASAPEVLVQQVSARLRELGAGTVAESAGREENVVFALPKELR